MSFTRDDRSDLKPGTPEWDAEKDRRRGQPHGEHILRPEEDEPMRANPYTRKADVSEFVEMMRAMQVGASPPSPPVKPDVWKWIGGLGSVIALLIAIVTQAHGIIESNKETAIAQQKFIDQVESMKEQVKAIGDRQKDNIPRLDAAVNENKAQADTINAIRESIAEERRQRAEEASQFRKAQADLAALLTKLADKLAEIDKTVAVMQAPGRRSETGVSREHDASLVYPQHDKQ